MGGYVDAVLEQLSSSQKGPAQIFVATKTLTAAEMLGMFAAPVILLPAPGLKKMYCVLAAMIHYRFVTTPYTLDAGGSNLHIQPTAGNTTGLFFLMNSAGCVDQIIDTIGVGFGTGAGKPLASYENKPMTITELAANAMTLGDGEVTVTTFYTIIDVDLS
jgi:hypothetical protein